jgi:hypothetical protein
MDGVRQTSSSTSARRADRQACATHWPAVMCRRSSVARYTRRSGLSAETGSTRRPTARRSPRTDVRDRSVRGRTPGQNRRQRVDAPPRQRIGHWLERERRGAGQERSDTRHRPDQREPCSHPQLSRVTVPECTRCVSTARVCRRGVPSENPSGMTTARAGW